MTEPRRFSDELGQYVDPREAAAIDDLAQLLRDERPRPRPAVRAELRGRLSRLDARPSRWQPRRPARIALSYAGSGLLLLLVAAIGLAGIGPLA